MGVSGGGYGCTNGKGWGLLGWTGGRRNMGQLDKETLGQKRLVETVIEL